MQNNNPEDLLHKIFDTSNTSFDEIALQVFNYQYQHNLFYKSYCDLLQCNPININTIEKIPFLPIQFFKSHNIKTTDFEEEIIFESSTTTGSISSKHFVKDCSIYEKCFSSTFTQFYGAVENYCIIGLLPSYLERQGSSLVYMVDCLIKKSNHQRSGFYLYDYEKLHNVLLENETNKQPTILIGVTYALLHFAEQYPQQLEHTIVMETGGMKGRREELSRTQVHEILKQNFGLKNIHSEYGMTELLSQAYSDGAGIFKYASYMKILLRQEDDPLAIIAKLNVNKAFEQGCINVVDLANIYSCSFIATDDLGKLYNDGSFEVLGRIDNSDIRGCGLMIM